MLFTRRDEFHVSTEGHQTKLKVHYNEKIFHFLLECALHIKNLKSQIFREQLPCSPIGIIVPM